MIKKPKPYRSKAKIVTGPSKAKTVSKIRRTQAQTYGSREDWEQTCKLVKERDGYRCTRCSSTKHLQVDHIVEVSKGGSNRIYNLRTLCADCHAKRPSHRKAKNLILSHKKRKAVK